MGKTYRYRSRIRFSLDAEWLTPPPFALTYAEYCAWLNYEHHRWLAARQERMTRNG